MRKIILLKFLSVLTFVIPTFASDLVENEQKIENRIHILDLPDEILEDIVMKSIVKEYGFMLRDLLPIKLICTRFANLSRAKEVHHFEKVIKLQEKEFKQLNDFYDLLKENQEELSKIILRHVQEKALEIEKYKEKLKKLKIPYNLTSDRP